MNEKQKPTSYVHIDGKLCTGCTNSVKACPTQAIRVQKGKHIQISERCIGCGECIRVCPTGAVRAVTCELDELEKDQISVALVSPVLYAQFPGVMPETVLHGLRLMGFQHAVDMSYFLEMFQCAAEEFIERNRITRASPLPLISPICPVVVRLIAFQFPSLLSHVLPIMRPVALMARDVNHRIREKYGVKKKGITLYYINPCPTKMDPGFINHHEGPYVDRALGINDVYIRLRRKTEEIKKTGLPPSSDMFDYGVTPSSLIWGRTGGEIAGMSTDQTLAISGLKETITYLEKIEVGMFQDIEYMEFRICPTGCVGGTLTAIDKYIAKNSIQKMTMAHGLKKRVSRDQILPLYKEGGFAPKKSLSNLACVYGARKETFSIEELQKIDALLEKIQGRDCSFCGAPNCRAFAEDVIKGRASVSDCLVFQARKKNP